MSCLSCVPFPQTQEYTATELMELYSVSDTVMAVQRVKTGGNKFC